ncbi:hypothetical protein J2X46_004285 [Nocardioides sp. BE266]|uniref:hypothetical protein n=1 Tax=Nocardioides sp. BE266 TaxID=2817725 RepID=UPI002862943E|nr:hypothetical protein [Nocardioides sp. BE266]MDR7255283.1 hypothetical protein [Nocardioides sp. BE266]
MTIQRTDATPTPESDEQYVRGVIDSAMSGTRPPLDLSSAALARGRRLRTRRRVVLASTAVAATVLAAVAAQQVLPGNGDAARDGSDLVATPGPAPLPEAPRGWWDMPATEMVTTVEAILPDGITVTDPGPLEADTPEGGPAHGWISSQLSGATGPGSLNVILSPYVDEPITVTEEGTSVAPTSGTDRGCEAPELSSATSCVEVPEGDEVVVAPSGPDSDISCEAEFSGRTTCAQIRDEQGTVVGRRRTNRWGGTVMTEVVLRRDGGTVYAASANTLDDKWGADSPLSATQPPLTLDQLEDLVRNDAWVSYEP